jgi:hypothetical protein
MEPTPDYRLWDVRSLYVQRHDMLEILQTDPSSSSGPDYSTFRLPSTIEGDIGPKTHESKRLTDKKVAAETGYSFGGGFYN